MSDEAWLWGAVFATAAWCVLGTRWTRSWPGTRPRPRFPSRVRGIDLAMVGLAWILVTLLGPRSDPERFLSRDVRDWNRFLIGLRTAGQSETPSPARRLWFFLDDKTRARIEGAEPAAAATLADETAGTIDAALRRRDFPGDEDFANVPFLRWELLDADEETLPNEARTRLHRAMLEAAFPDLIRPSIRSLLTHVAIQNTALCLIIPVLLWLAAGIRPYQLGLHGAHAGSYFLFGATQWTIWAPITFAVNLLVRAYWGQQTAHPVQDFFLVPRATIDWLLVIYTTTIAAPVLEELLFRGLLQAWLVNRLGVIGGIGLTASLFGLAHGSSWPDPVPLALLGIGLGVAYQRTRSLVAPVALHGIFNGIMVAIGALYG